MFILCVRAFLLTFRFSFFRKHGTYSAVGGGSENLCLSAPFLGGFFPLLRCKDNRAFFSATERSVTEYKQRLMWCFWVWKPERLDFNGGSHGEAERWWHQRQRRLPWFQWNTSHFFFSCRIGSKVTFWYCRVVCFLRESHRFKSESNSRVDAVWATSEWKRNSRSLSRETSEKLSSVGVCVAHQHQDSSVQDTLYSWLIHCCAFYCRALWPMFAESRGQISSSQLHLNQIPITSLDSLGFKAAFFFFFIPDVESSHQADGWNILLCPKQHLAVMLAWEKGFKKKTHHLCDFCWKQTHQQRSASTGHRGAGWIAAPALQEMLYSKHAHVVISQTQTESSGKISRELLQTACEKWASRPPHCVHAYQEIANIVFRLFDIASSLPQNSHRRPDTRDSAGTGSERRARENVEGKKG